MFQKSILSLNRETIQKSYDFLMNKSFRKSCKRLVYESLKTQKQSEKPKILDIGCGTSLILQFIHENNLLDFEYFGLETDSELIDKSTKRSVQLGVTSKTNFFPYNILDSQLEFKNAFDVIFSNFQIYKLNNRTERIKALKNIRSYLKKGGTFHIGLPSEHYSASNIAIQCLKDELSDKQNPIIKLIRSSLLVPYQWKYVLTPIEEKINSGNFIKFNQDMIKEEFEEAQLKIIEFKLDYGFCGYHIHGTKG